uniref:Inhibitor_I29 domain-containing protein n=1 Tax=Panagrellus redivivus TaxID=6233 RepID=A0A7E4V5R6_PANRE
MDSDAAEAASARFKAAMERVYGPYDPEFKNMKAMEAEYAYNHFFTNQILHNPGNEFYDAFRGNRDRISQEAEKMNKANEEKAQKKLYEEWMKRRKAHQQRSTMPFMERPPRVSTSVIKFFEHKDKEDEALRKQLEATMMNDDAPLFSASANHGLEYPPTHHVHLNPLMPSSSTSTKDNLDTAESAVLPIRSQSLKPTIISAPMTVDSTILLKDEKQRARSAHPIIHSQPPKPMPSSLALSDADSEVVLPKTAPSAHLDPLMASSAASSTILSKGEKEILSPTRPLIYPLPSKPNPSSSAPTVSVPIPVTPPSQNETSPEHAVPTASEVAPPRSSKKLSRKERKKANKEKIKKEKERRRLGDNTRCQSLKPTPVTPMPSDAESEPDSSKIGHITPLMPNSASSSTILPKDEKKTAEWARRPSRFPPLKPTPISPTLSDAEAELGPPTAAPSHNPLLSMSPASSTIPLKDEKEKLSPTRPLIYPLPSKPEPSSSAPIVSVPIPVTPPSQNETSPEHAVPTAREVAPPCSSKKLSRKEKKKANKENMKKEKERRRLGDAPVEDDFIVDDLHEKSQKKQKKNGATGKRRRKTLAKNPFCH